MSFDSCAIRMAGKTELVATVEACLSYSIDVRGPRPRKNKLKMGLIITQPNLINGLINEQLGILSDNPTSRSSVSYVPYEFLAIYRGFHRPHL